MRDKRTYYEWGLFLITLSLIPQLVICTINWKSQMLQGNWVELIFLEMTLQTIYHFGTRIRECINEENREGRSE